MSSLPPLLKADFKMLLPEVLYPVICKAGCKHSVVKMAAINCLNAVATECGFGDIKR
jgi:hypothetical protein